MNDTWREFKEGSMPEIGQWIWLYYKPENKTYPIMIKDKYSPNNDWLWQPAFVPDTPKHLTIKPSPILEGVSNDYLLALEARIRALEKRV